MVQANVDVIWAAIEAMNRRDIEGVLRLMDRAAVGGSDQRVPRRRLASGRCHDPGV